MLNPIKDNDTVNQKPINSRETADSGNLGCNQTGIKDVIVTLPKPRIQVQFLVGTPLQKTRFHWGFRFLRFPRGPESTALSSNFPPTEARMEPGPARIKSDRRTGQKSDCLLPCVSAEGFRKRRICFLFLQQRP